MRPLPLLLCLALCACGQNATAPAADTTAQAEAPSRAPVAGDHAFRPAIDAADFAAHVQQLASDAFGGRGPGTPGEQKTVDYIKAQFARIGLQPGNGEQWFQTVPMVRSVADPSTVLHLSIGDTRQDLAFGTDMVVGSHSEQPRVELKDSPLVFVGYGIDAPERGWNDYAGLDVRGKTVVILVNDPGFASGDPRLFDGKRMTYYGRWTYKFEEAARKGAAAALIIHDTPGASYGWDVVRNSWSGPQYYLPASVDPAPRLPIQGWLSGEAAKALFAAAGQDLGRLRAAAGKPGFKPVPLPATASVALQSTLSTAQSRNVLGLLPGREAADEAIVYMAHWDHLGTHADEPGDNIYNGAVDNATGVAALLELAEAFQHAPTPPKRSILFLAVTLEESGLLGSQYYVAHPVIPLAKTVAVFNIDALAPIGKARDITVVGKGNSELEDLLAEVLRQQGRRISEESNPAAGYYFRSDHFNFAKAGVPALYIDSGEALVDGGRAAGEAATRDYTAHRYHTPADQYDPATWKLDGIVQDLDALYAVGARLTNDGQWPAWRAGSPFKAARDAMRPPAAAAGAPPAR
ncbi:M28 family metallopeptidase [Thermomonas haemolytica]|uniref:Zn-dependent M28 family amino/carboxypeptidase n=1 Tax=Thermomonas haemolytica TaxID=141949 RepID=A0A4R3MZ67_9GAMM|nr:M28 family metallopeptidase [Thermomonas haemolytica]TCT20043.1 Zn-dependent M28 family amino/carboxypeptidase [Thermomonas haemolytica]TNY29964.1 aminopeptidase [Thermomonas haemolytica]